MLYFLQKNVGHSCVTRLSEPRCMHIWVGFQNNLVVLPLLQGGVEDHVHLLARFGRTITQADWVKELKRVSNLWLKEQYGMREFEWQGGYADFSVSASNLEQVRQYVVNQAAHHAKINFQDELRMLLRRYKVEWDERYIWE